MLLNLLIDAPPYRNQVAVIDLFDAILERAPLCFETSQLVYEERNENQFRRGRRLDTLYHELTSYFGNLTVELVYSSDRSVPFAEEPIFLVEKSPDLSLQGSD